MQKKEVHKSNFTSGLDSLNKEISSKNNFNVGVWTGIRAIEHVPFGISSALLRVFNTDGVHMAVRINGVSYSLDTDIGGDIYLENIQNINNDSDDYYEWTYNGLSQKSNQEVVDMIYSINQKKIKYDLIERNCQDVSEGLSLWAQGYYSNQHFFAKLTGNKFSTEALVSKGICNGISFLSKYFQSS